MICQDRPRITRGLRNVSSPGGVTKHFRIQVLDSEADSWRMYASFRFAGEAEACLNVLLERGIQARLIVTDLCPTAY